MLSFTTAAQTTYGFEEYYFTRSDYENPLLISKIFYQTARNWYIESRYNYEERRSVSFATGKTFKKEGAFSFDITPMAGLSINQYTQASLELNSTLQYRRLLFSSEAQYYISLTGSSHPLFCSWSEAGTELNGWASVGVVSQTAIHCSSGIQNDPGIFLRLSFGKWELPLYLFNPATIGETHVVVGLNREFSTKIDKRKSFL
jgi:hypothetical protein